MSASENRASLNIRLVQAREALMLHFRPLLNQIGITDQQWRIIRLLAENGTTDFQDLGRAACILRPSLTGILTRLEKMGYVVRLKPSNDQRKVFLQLTGKGESLYKDFRIAVDTRYDVIVKGFSSEKLDHLSELLQEFTRSAMESFENNRESD